MLTPDRRLLLAALSAACCRPRAGPRRQAPAGITLRARRETSALPGWRRSPKKMPASLIKRHRAGAAQHHPGHRFRRRPEDQVPRRPCPVGAWTGARSGVLLSSQPIFRPIRWCIHAVEGGKAREILYGPDYFDYGASGLDPKALAKLGFAGFRVMDGQNKPTDWLAFQGASYFRSSRPGRAIWRIGPRHRHQHRGCRRAEEFPRFSPVLAGGERAGGHASMPCWTGRASPAPTNSTP